MPTTKNPNTVVTGQGTLPTDTVSSSALNFEPLASVQEGTSSIEVTYNGGTAWADGTPNGAGSVEATFDNLFFYLGGSSGDSKIGATSYSFLPGGTLRNNITALVDALGVSLSPTAGSARLGVAPVAGFSHREIDDDPGPGVQAGGLGDLVELGGSPKLSDILSTIDTQLKRRRTFYTMGDTTIHSSDIGTIGSSTAFGQLNDQIAGKGGGSYFVHAPTSTTPVAFYGSYQSPYMLGEARYHGDAVPTDEADVNNSLVLQPFNTVDSTMNGVWENFSHLPNGTGQFVFYPGYEGRFNTYYNDSVILRGSSPGARPIVFHCCMFTRTAANTAGDVTTITDSGDGAGAVFENCIFSGGSGTNANLVTTTLSTNLAAIDRSRTITFRNCIFYGVGCQRCYYNSGMDQAIHFVDCEFWGDPASTEYMFESSGDGVRLTRCKFHGSPHLFRSLANHVVRDCTFYVNVDRTDTAKNVICVTPFADQEVVWENNRIFLESNIGAVQTTTPVALFAMRIVTINGLYIYYGNSITQQSLSTLYLDYDTSEDPNYPSKVSNVHIDLNNKTASSSLGSSYPNPMNLYSYGEPGPYYVVENVTIAGVGQGNPSATGAQGIVMQIGEKFVVNNLAIWGSMSNATTNQQVWLRVVEIGSRSTVDKLKLNSNTTSIVNTAFTPRGDTTVVLAAESSLLNSTLDMTTQSSVAGLSGVTGIIYLSNLNTITLRGNTIRHTPVECPTITTASTSICHYISIIENRFDTSWSTNASFPLIFVDNAADAWKIMNNYFDHSHVADSPKAISGDISDSLIADNYFFDGTDLIDTGTGTGSIERDNIYG